ncbi:MAG: hypothetical protein DCC59_01360 [Chloroflexi bacterium]|nr:hypothetical protein [Chloroflexi bacterium CFX1]MCK6567636.1 hypothetical protein [Anaerolineales bacterium]MCQ3952928.1 hypothetical protein [Chloroflexota bacterium]MDL1919957.1 hypothetical protein [Chloroflexi bacterium CFX5]RIK55237.1 MAG: hypothetical protein DCC59_01360 [Chloroflexota bacterium]
MKSLSTDGDYSMGDVSGIMWNRRRNPATAQGIIARMDFFFPEDNLIRATPEETRVTSLAAEALPDGRRVRVNLEITPFQKRPYIEAALNDADGEEVASTSVVEPLSWKLEFIMHIRGEIRNPYALTVRLYYPEGGPSDEPRRFVFEVHPRADAN